MYTINPFLCSPTPSFLESRLITRTDDIEDDMSIEEDAPSSVAQSSAGDEPMTLSPLDVIQIEDDVEEVEEEEGSAESDLELTPDFLREIDELVRSISYSTSVSDVVVVVV